MWQRVVLGVAGVGLLGAGLAQGQRPQPREERIGDGYLIQVLRPGDIPAIVAPRFVPRAEAEAFMDDNEPVLGVFDGRVAKAYSLWHLDRHEVVNDTGAFGPIAVTW